MSFLEREFFQRDPLACSRELVGCAIVWGECRGIIVETEAYLATGDEACHTFSRPSTREFVARNNPGTAYVYLNYGMYWLFNVLVKGGKDGAADGFVLIRALEPTQGLELMRERRGQQALHALCSGPGKLTQAFGITGTDHGLDLCGGKVGFWQQDNAVDVVEVETDVRVGINRAAHLPWRFLMKGNAFVSVRKAGEGRGLTAAHAPGSGRPARKRR